MNTFFINNSVYRTSTQSKTRTDIRKRSSSYKIRVLELRRGFKRPKLAAKQILIDFTGTSSASFLTQETLHSGTYLSKFPFRNLHWSLYVFSNDYSRENSYIPGTTTIQTGKYLGILGRDSGQDRFGTLSHFH